MLVLSRKVGERVLVGDKVVVTVVRIGPNAVRLGLEAPKDMNIVREELADLEVPVSGEYEVLSEDHERAVENAMINHG